MSDRQCAEAIVDRAWLALERGGPVLVLVEPPVEAAVRDRLGLAALRVGFRPHSWLAERAPSEIVDSVFDPDVEPASAGRITVLTQQPRHDSYDGDFWLAAECTVNSTLAAREVDLTCFIDQNSTERHLDVARMTHPVVAIGDVDVDNPDYTPPEILLLREVGADLPDLGPPDSQHVVDPVDPSRARRWLRVVARQATLPDDVSDELLIVAGEAVMTSWEAHRRFTIVPDNAESRPTPPVDPLGGVRVLLWPSADEVICDVLAPVHFGELLPHVPPADLRLQWLWMANLISPRTRVAIFDRIGGMGSCIRVRIARV